MTDKKLRDEIQSCVSIKSTYHIDSFDMKTITQKVYGKRIEVGESPNDTTHEYDVDGVIEDYDEEELQEAINTSYMAAWQYGLIFNDLCRKGYLDKGEYFMRVSW